MGYASFKGSPKELVGEDDIAPGSIGLHHLAKELFAAIQKIGLHSHTGAQSRKVRLSDVEGAFGSSGFLIYSSDGTKRYRATVDSGTGAFVLTEV